MKIFALHGFFGLRTDWEFLQKSFLFKNSLEMVELTAHPIDSLWGWAAHFNHYVNQSSSPPNCVIGYSLGGRLALHTLLLDPTLWQAAIIVSAHCGYDLEDQKKARAVADENWAKHFESSEWDQLVMEWNSQTIFHKNYTFRRCQKKFSRSQLAGMLRNLTLAKQDSLFVKVENLFLPILWITGEEDQRFTEHAKAVQLSHPLSKKIAIPKAGHRAPWEQSENFLRELEIFLKQIRA